MLKRIGAALAATPLIILASATAGHAVTYQPSPTASSPFALDPNRWVIAHRGGDALYPEEGYRGYNASSLSRFALELDVRQTKDGRWVLLHDATVDRTIRGITGDVSALTLAQFMGGYLRPAPNGAYTTDRPATLGGFMTRYDNGRNIIVLEHKGGSVSALTAYVKARGLNTVRTTMIQSFSFTDAKAFSKSGLTTMLLMGKHWTMPLADVKAAGIKYLGVARDMGSWDVGYLKRQGFTVVAYSVNTKTDLDGQTARGVDGVFSDNPWKITAP